MSGCVAHSWHCTSVQTLAPLPCKFISMGEGSRERKAVSPSLPHLAVLHVVQKHWCQNWAASPSTNLESASQESSSHHPYTTSADRSTGNDLPQHLPARQKQDWVYNLNDHVLHLQREAFCIHTTHPLRGVSQILCKVQRSGHLQLRPLGASVGRKKCCHKGLRFAWTVLQGKKKGHLPHSETHFNTDVSIKELLAARSEASCFRQCT